MIEIALGFENFSVAVVDDPPPARDGAPDRRAFVSGVAAVAVVPVQLHFGFMLIDDDAQEEIKAWRRHRRRR